MVLFSLYCFLIAIDYSNERKDCLCVFTYFTDALTTILHWFFVLVEAQQTFIDELRIEQSITFAVLVINASISFGSIIFITSLNYKVRIHIDISSNENEPEHKKCDSLNQINEYID